MHGTRRCVFKLDTAHIHVMATSNHESELATCNMHLLFHTVQSGLGVSDIQPTGLSGVEVVDEQCAWYVEVCV